MFVDRTEAGRLLAGLLEDYPRESMHVLALDASGAPVGRAIADQLGVPFDVIVVEPISPPRDPDVAIGWVTAHGATWLDRDRLRRLFLPPGYLATETERQRTRAIEREQRLRGGTGRWDLAHKLVILVADGISDEGRVTAAVRDLKNASRPPAWIALAAPVVWPEARKRLPKLVDEVLLLHTPAAIATVGQDYRDYAPVDDEQLRQLLQPSLN
jgi:predicted phosphoribosyltransferase